MADKLDEKAKEGSTYIIVFEFFEKTSAGVTSTPVVPKDGLKWSLRDGKGVIVNERDDILLTPAQTVHIVLTGDDLSLSANYSEERTVTVEGNYDSVYGNDLVLLDEATFQIIDSVGAP